jgi:hypothetical protein
MGSRPDRLELIPWSRIDFVRIQPLTVNGRRLDKLQVHLTDGPQIDLTDDYDVSLESLAGRINEGLDWAGR